jgi:hypothetical protein
MIVTYVMVAVCVVGVIGGVASALSYDKPYGEIRSPMRIPKRSRRSPRGSRRSRQLQALDAALTEEAAIDQPTPHFGRTAAGAHDGPGASRRRPQ